MKKEELSAQVVQFAQGLLCVVLIWFVGWLGLSNAWIIASYAVFVFWKKKKEQREEKWQAMRFFADYDNLKTMKNLPSWVRRADIVSNFFVLFTSAENGVNVLFLVSCTAVYFCFENSFENRYVLKIIM